MSDHVSSESRSRNMSAIKGKDTTIEKYIRKLLFSKGYRFRKNVKTIMGKPDIYLPKYKTVVFIHGCFWHRHPGCKYAYTPKTRQDFWQKKFITNIERDRVVKEALLHSGLKMLIIWECTVNLMMRDNRENIAQLKAIEEFLISEQNYREL